MLLRHWCKGETRGAVLWAASSVSWALIVKVQSVVSWSEPRLGCTRACSKLQENPTFRVSVCRLSLHLRKPEWNRFFLREALGTSDSLIPGVQGSRISQRSPKSSDFSFLVHDSNFNMGSGILVRRHNTTLSTLGYRYRVRIVSNVIEHY